MAGLTKVKCDHRLGELPGEQWCDEPPVFECTCVRCQEDPFRSCAEHRDAVQQAHSRVFPNHAVLWVVSRATLPAPPVVEEPSDSAATSFIQHTPLDLRRLGWSVAVHNDYRLNGEFHTFWLLTKGDRCVKGEGRTDMEALDSIRAQLRTQNGT